MKNTVVHGGGGEWAAPSLARARLGSRAVPSAAKSGIASGTARAEREGRGGEGERWERADTGASTAVFGEKAAKLRHLTPGSARAASTDWPQVLGTAVGR